MKLKEQASRSRPNVEDPSAIDLGCQIRRNLPVLFLNRSRSGEAAV